MVVERRLRAQALLCLALATACATPPAIVDPELRAAAEQRDALAVSDALEQRIANGTDTPADREFAYAMVSAIDGDTAAEAFARAAVTGRLVQLRGMRGAPLIGEVEKWAVRSRGLDPKFRDGAATRLLGTLYVIAPGSLVRYGDSERGLELLEGLVREHPEIVENHLRLAEAYIALGDPDPAAPALCVCLAKREALRRDDQQLLDQLLATAGTPECGAPD